MAPRKPQRKSAAAPTKPSKRTGEKENDAPSASSSGTQDLGALPATEAVHSSPAGCAGGLLQSEGPASARAEDLHACGPSQEGALPCAFAQKYCEKEARRDEYLESLREENAFLRAINSTVLDYEKSTGLSIRKRESGGYRCVHSAGEGEDRAFIAFELSPSGDSYAYRHVESNIELPEYLKKDIFFKENQLQLFFFNVYECVIKESARSEG